MTFSITIIMFNKYILTTRDFQYPLFLTTWHLVFASIATQILARCTGLLSKKIDMKPSLYIRAIVPIGIFFSASLVCSNQALMHISVSFSQMIKATMPVVVLIVTWIFRIESPNFTVLGKVSFIVLGVMIASYGELEFHLLGFIFQSSGILAEAFRLVLMQSLLAGFKMDPLVSLYYFAPICAVMNAFLCLVLEGPRLSLAIIQALGMWTLLLNGMVSFGLNVAVVFVIGRTSSLALCLSGILKDIILVVASTLIFRSPITFIQLVGYGTALGGLTWYKAGDDLAKMQISQQYLNRRWLIAILGISSTLGVVYMFFPQQPIKEEISAYDIMRQYLPWK